MPTFKICVFEHQQRKDGKFRVSIRLTHNRQRVFIATDTYVVRKQINADFSGIKDAEITRRIDKDILRYEDILLRGIGSNMSKYTAKELADYITNWTATEGGANIDFVAFSRAHIAKLKAERRKGYAEPFDALIRHLIDFMGREKINIKEINTKTLQKFEEYLREPRKMIRINQHGKAVEINRGPLKDQTIADYFGDLRTLFNAAVDEYNDEDEELALITHNPFRKYKIKVTDEPDKRDLSVADLVKIINAPEYSGRCGLARDVFLLSFYFIGMNTADLFAVDEVADGRITYRRQKTTTRRKDEALMSVKIEPEVEVLMKKYRDPSKKRVFRFHNMYTDHRIFNANLNKGLKQLADKLGLPPGLSTYYARHTMATIAFNYCGFSEAEIGMALNHVGGFGKDLDAGLRVTRGYINRDWSRVDTFNRTVLDIVADVAAGKIEIGKDGKVVPPTKKKEAE